MAAHEGVAGAMEGGNPWSPAWLRVTEDAGSAPLVARARAALRRGELHGLMLQRGRVDARIGAGRASAERVRLTIPVAPATDWLEFERRVRARRGPAPGDLAQALERIIYAYPEWVCGCGAVQWEQRCWHATAVLLALAVVWTRAPGLVLAVCGAEPRWWGHLRWTLAPAWPGLALEDAWVSAGVAVGDGGPPPSAAGNPTLRWCLPWRAAALADPRLGKGGPQALQTTEARADAFWLGDGGIPRAAAAAPAAAGMGPGAELAGVAGAGPAERAAADRSGPLDATEGGGAPAGEGTRGEAREPEALDPAAAALVERAGSLRPPRRWWGGEHVGEALVSLYGALAAPRADGGPQGRGDDPEGVDLDNLPFGFSPEERAAWAAGREQAAAAGRRDRSEATAGGAADQRAARSAEALPPGRGGERAVTAACCPACRQPVDPAWRYCAACGAGLGG